MERPSINPDDLFNILDGLEEALAPNPVSYTHLDVYKRQVHGRSQLLPHQPSDLPHPPRRSSRISRR